MILKKQPLISIYWYSNHWYPPGTDHISHQTGKGKSSSSYCSALVEGIYDRFREGYPFIEHSFGPQKPMQRWWFEDVLSPKNMGYITPLSECCGFPWLQPKKSRAKKSREKFPATHPTIPRHFDGLHHPGVWPREYLRRETHQRFSHLDDDLLVSLSWLLSLLPSVLMLLLSLFALCCSIIIILHHYYYDHLWYMVICLNVILIIPCHNHYHDHV